MFGVPWDSKGDLDASARYRQMVTLLKIGSTVRGHIIALLAISVPFTLCPPAYFSIFDVANRCWARMWGCQVLFVSWGLFEGALLSPVMVLCL